MKKKAQAAADRKAKEDAKAASAEKRSTKKGKATGKAVSSAFHKGKSTRMVRRETTPKDKAQGPKSEAQVKKYCESTAHDVMNVADKFDQRFEILVPLIDKGVPVPVSVIKNIATHLRRIEAMIGKYIKRFEEIGVGFVKTDRGNSLDGEEARSDA